MVILVNLVTHPLLWHIDSRVNIGILSLEFGVFMAEAIVLSLFFWKKIKLRPVVTYALIANASSWIIGYIIFLIL